uniref:Uncharacterized protein n=1 Tax=Mus musculus TaxID=10090 RepID=Q8BKY3_MOUSE|nr:unnamed protein product [Mus musculus]
MFSSNCSKYDRETHFQDTHLAWNRAILDPLQFPPHPIRSNRAKLVLALLCPGRSDLSCSHVFSNYGGPVNSIFLLALMSRTVSRIFFQHHHISASWACFRPPSASCNLPQITSCWTWC